MWIVGYAGAASWLVREGRAGLAVLGRSGLVVVDGRGRARVTPKGRIVLLVASKLR